MSRRIGNNIISGASTTYDWVGTLTEYNTAVTNNAIQPSWVCWITDDYLEPTTANIPDSEDRRYITEAQKTIVSGLHSTDTRTLNCHSVSQSYTANTLKKCVITNIYTDTLSEISTSTSRITFSKDTHAIVSFSIVGAVASTKTIYIYRNGSSYNSQPFYGSGGSYVFVGPFTAGHYLEFYFLTSSAETVSVQIMINSLVY